MEILKELQNGSHFEVNTFNNKLLLRGRILTASEIEQVGLGSTLLAQEIFINQKDNVSGIDEIRNKAEKEGFENLEESELLRLLDFVKSIRPELLESIHENQDKILCKVITHGSQDEGITWEQLKLVPSSSLQNAETNCLWVGMLSREDKDKLLNKALQGQEEATKRLERFQK